MCRQDGQQDDHEDTHSFLSIIISMKKTHQGTGQQQDTADPPRSRHKLIILRLLKNVFVFDHIPEDVQHHDDGGESKCRG